MERLALALRRGGRVRPCAGHAQALGIDTNTFVPGTTSLSATTVDWVRVGGAPTHLRP
jgi:hypothetical protein